MVKEFCLAWEKNKWKLEEYFRTTKQDEYGDYENLVKLLFDIVINPSIEDDYYWFDTENILVIDDGDWQGTRVFILHRDCYQPSVEDYVYTNTYYGSCSGCDTLLGISGYDSGLPNDQQVKDYMELCLHLLQKLNFMVDMVLTDDGRRYHAPAYEWELYEGEEAAYTKLLNPYGEYLVKFAQNHGMSISEAASQPMVKARLAFFNETGK